MPSEAGILKKKVSTLLNNDLQINVILAKYCWKEETKIKLKKHNNVDKLHFWNQIIVAKTKF